nr:hypothetical protein 19 [Candidatus Hydrogenedentota bacterium]
MRGTTIILVSTITCLAFTVVGCSKSNSQKSVEQEFESYYQAWKAETHNSIHSDTPWYTSRPSFRSIVALGPAAVPFLKAKLEEDQKHGNGDFFLASAVVEIYGWDRSDFYEEGKIIGEQGFRDNVLKRLNQE